MKHSAKSIGERGEQAAMDYLVDQGLTLVEKNFNCRLGEIDLIMREGEWLVFIEVRVRHNRRFASPLESIHHQKQQRLINTAQFYLQQHRLIDRVACRFDAVAINLQTNPPAIEWVKNAF